MLGNTKVKESRGMELPNDEIMRQMARVANEKITASMADFADQFAGTLPDDITGKEALTAFAAAIRSNNKPHYPTGEPI